MFPREALTELARENQKVIVVAIRLLDEIQRRNGPVAQSHVPDATGVSALVYEEVKDKLAKYFPYHGGRYHFPTEVERPEPWDIEPKNAKKLDRALATLKTERERANRDDPKTKLILRLQKLLGESFREAERKYYMLTRTHSVQRVEGAVARAEEKQPHSPFGYLLNLLKSGETFAPPTGGAGGRTGPMVVFAFQKPANAETAKAEQIGWEAPSRFDADGNPVWPTGERRAVWRMRTGHVQLTEPRKGETPPSHIENPGVIVK